MEALGSPGKLGPKAASAVEFKVVLVEASPVVLAVAKALPVGRVDLAVVKALVVVLVGKVLGVALEVVSAESVAVLEGSAAVSVGELEAVSVVALEEAVDQVVVV